MGKFDKKRDLEEQSSAPLDASESPMKEPARAPEKQSEKQAPKQPAAPWRRVALCIKSGKVYLNGHLARVFGGEWITDAMQAKTLERDHEHFRMVDVESPEVLASMMDDHAKAVEALRVEAKKLGMVVYREGEAIPVKR